MNFISKNLKFVSKKIKKGAVGNVARGEIYNHDIVQTDF